MKTGHPVVLLPLLLAVLPTSSSAAVSIVSDDFDSYSTAGDFTGSAEATLIADGGGGNQVQISANTGGGGFFAPGFQWTPTIQPGPNNSTNLADYTVSFDFTYTSTYTTGIEVWITYGAADFGVDAGTPDDGANLYGFGGFTTGVTQTISFTLDAGHANPFQYGDPFDPTAEPWIIQINAIDFGSAADQTATFTVDNFNVTVVPEPSAALLGGLGLLALLRRRRA